MPFISRRRIEEAGGSWVTASNINSALANLKRDRLAYLSADEDFFGCRTAWKVAVLRQTLTYRIVDLADASINQWMQGDSLASIILARSLVETAALTHHYGTGFAVAVSRCDLDKVDRLAMQGSSGGKHEYWQLGAEMAVNVRTALEQLGKELPGARTTYERISEIVHPNAHGVNQFYATSEEVTGQTGFSREKRGRAEVLPHFVAAMLSLEWARAKLDAVDRLIPAIMGLHQAGHGERDDRKRVSIVDEVPAA